MATKKGTAQLHSSRNRSKQPMPGQEPGFAPHETHTTPHHGDEIIEDERDRLMKAEAILQCVSIAMDATDGDSANSPYYQAAISVACDLVSQSINRLAPVRVRPTPEKSLSQDQEGIRESTPSYLH